MIRRLAALGLVLALLGCGTGESAGGGQSGSSAVGGTDTTGPPACTTEPDQTTEPATTADTAPTASASPGTSATTSSATEATEAATTDTATTVEPTEQTTTSSTAPADPELVTAQTALDSLGYWLGDIDGVMGSNTAHAITAFQKAEGLDRTGRLDPATLERLAGGSRPGATTTSGEVVEIDLSRQILLVVADGQVEWVFDISTGTPATPTPPGEFSVYKEIDGYRHAPLGILYRPKYFNGGIAMHGYTSVPNQPASHGCVRLTYPAMDMVWDADLAPLGRTVVVY